MEYSGTLGWSKLVDMYDKYTEGKPDEDLKNLIDKLNSFSHDRGIGVTKIQVEEVLEKFYEVFEKFKKEIWNI